MSLRTQFISAGRFEQWFSGGGARPGGAGVRVTVQGVVHIRATPQRPPPCLADFVFEDLVDLQDARVGGPLDFSRCVFARGLVLRSAKIDGELRLDSAEFPVDVARPPLTVGIDLTSARVAGGLRGQNLRMPDTVLDASGARIRYHVNLDGARIAAFRGHGVRINGDLLLNGLVRADIVVRTQIDKIDLEVAEIRGNVEMSGLSAKIVYLRNARLSGELMATVVADGRANGETYPTEIGESADFAGIRVGGRVYLVGAHIARLSLRSAGIDGGFVAASACKRTPNGENAPVPSQFKSLDLASAEVGADLTLKGVAIGKLTLTSASVNGTVAIGSDFSLRLKDGQISEAVRDQVRQDRNLWLMGTPTDDDDEHDPGSIGHGDDELAPLSSSGELRSTLHECIARFLRANGSIELAGVRVRHDLKLNGATVRGHIWITPDRLSDATGEFSPEVGHDLHLSGIQNQPYVGVLGLRCVGQVRVVGSQLGTARFGPAPVKDAISPCLVGLLRLADSRIAGSLTLTHLQVDGAAPREGYQGVAIEGCTVDDELSFWRDTWIETVREDSPLRMTLGPPISAWDHGAAVVGPVKIRNCTIRGDCELSFLKSQGPISLEHNIIGGDLLLRSIVALASVFPNQQRALAKLCPQDPAYRVVAPALSLRMTSVGRDVNLSGLTLYREAGNPWAPEDDCGHLDARYFNVKGDLIAQDAARIDGQAVESHLVVPGRFDLASASAAHLKVSAHSFPLLEPCAMNSIAAPAHTTAERDRNGLMLNGGRFQTLTVLTVKREAQKPPPYLAHVDPLAWRTGCPVPMDLADLEVTTWHVGDSTEPSETQYKALLASDSRLRRSTYRSVERTLRNVGNDDAADEIYRAMEARSSAERRRRRPWIWQRIFDHLRDARERRVIRTAQVLGDFVAAPLGLIAAVWDRLLWPGGLRFGTDPRPLLIVVFMLALASYPVYRNPSNIEPSASRLAADSQRDAQEFAVLGVAPRYADWTVPDTLALLLRSHVPILPFQERGEWSMRDTPGIDYDLAAFGGQVCRSDDHKRAIDAPTSASDCSPAWLPPRFQITWASAEDFATVMTILNLLMWPLVLAFVARRVLRQ